MLLDHRNPAHDVKNLDIARTGGDPYIISVKRAGQLCYVYFRLSTLLLVNKFYKEQRNLKKNLDVHLESSDNFSLGPLEDSDRLDQVIWR